MISRNYQIGGKISAVNSIYYQVHDYCTGYESDEVPDFTVEIQQEDIDSEREKSIREDIAEERHIRSFPDPYHEELADYRKISEKMPVYDTILFHGSAVSIDGKGFLFTAKSGTGKSTHTALWREVFGDKAVMINDDKPLIRITEQEVTVFGTPYNGSHRIGNNISVPLKGLCILERSSRNSICKITKKQAYPMLIQQTYRPDNLQMLRKTLTLIDRMAEKVSLYRLECNMNQEAAIIAYQEMKG